MWDLEAGVELRTLAGHEGAVWALAVTLDSRRVVSGSVDRTLKVWDLDSGEEILTLVGHGDQVYAVAVTPDGRQLVSGSFDRTLKLWDLETGAELRTFTGHQGAVYAVAVTPAGRLVSGSGDRTLKVWDLETGAERQTLTGHKDVVSAVAVTPDGGRAVSGSADERLKVWDLENGAELRTLAGHEGAAWAVAATPDGRRAVSGSEDRTLKVWELEPPEPAPPPPGDETLGSATVLSDRPLGRDDFAGPDHLGYGPYAAALFQLITQEDTGLPLSMAVSAPWGSGKTSIMAWVRHELDEHREGRRHRCVGVPGMKVWEPTKPASASWWRRVLQRNSTRDQAEPRDAGSDPDRRTQELGLVRRCKTVWIDAWKYESSAALWAAFTKEIYRQAQRQVGGPLDRLKFRLALANSVEPGDSGYGWRSVAWAVLRNRFASLAALLSAGALGTGGFYAVNGITDVSASSEAAAGINGLIGLFGGALTVAKGWIRQPFSFDLDKVTAASQMRPEPVDGVTAPTDIESLVWLLAPARNDGLVVFVDDLDRCSPDKVKDAVEAINLLFNGAPGGRTVFMLGMDVDMVAASMRVAYEPMVAELTRRDSSAASDFGHRFLSKIVQLSFNLPEPQGPALEDFLDGLVGPSREAAPRARSRPRVDALPPERREQVVRDVAAAVTDKMTTTDRLEAVEALVERTPEPEREAVAEVALEEVRRENLRDLKKDSPQVQDAIRQGARFLPPRPRDYKRFVNAVRLQLLVANQSLKLEGSHARASNAQVAKWTALGMRWPVLAEEIRKRRELLGELEEWAVNGSSPDREWSDRILELMRDAEFGKTLAEEPALGAVELHGLLSVH